MSEIIRVNITSTRGNQPYEPRFLSIDGGRIIGCDFSNTLGYYLGYCSKELYEDRVAPIKEAMKRYKMIQSLFCGVLMDLRAILRIITLR